MCTHSPPYLQRSSPPYCHTTVQIPASSLSDDARPVMTHTHTHTQCVTRPPHSSCAVHCSVRVCVCVWCVCVCVCQCVCVCVTCLTLTRLYSSAIDSALTKLIARLPIAPSPPLRLLHRLLRVCIALSIPPSGAALDQTYRVGRAHIHTHTHIRTHARAHAARCTCAWEAAQCKLQRSSRAAEPHASTRWCSAHVRVHTQVCVSPWLVS